MILIYVSSATPNDILTEYLNKYAKRPIRFVQQWWDYSMSVALSSACDGQFEAISIPPVSTFPTSKCVHHQKHVVTDSNGVRFSFPTIWNLPIIKQLDLIRSIRREIRAICRQSKGERIVILTHCIYLQSAIPAFWARKKFCARVYTIVPDLPEHSTSVALNGHRILKWMFSLYISITRKLSRMFDGYVCFTEHQMKYLNQDKPHIVMEGFIDTALIDRIALTESHPNRIVYAGGLMYRYGIRELVDGFIKAAIPDAELYIYGQGEADEYVIGKEEHNVFYGGCVSREEAIRAEKSCFLLVNPRPTGDEYTKCSFPSKLMEYMATGIPVLTSKLGCIPKDYDDKLLYFIDISADSIASTLKSCFARRDQIREKGKLAKAFIRSKKNVQHQAQSIIRFIQTQELGK